MGIYIKGMEMPTRCENCLMITTDCNSDYICSVLDEYIPMKWEKIENYYGFYNKETYPKPDWCPLVEVPPHGDLIDRDAIPWRNANHPTAGKWIDEAHIRIMPTIIESDIDIMYYPQVDGITPTVIKTKAEDGT